MTGLGLVMTGTGPGTGPVIPTPLPSAGVSGYAHRLSAARLTGTNGSPVTTWADSGSSPSALVTQGTVTVDTTTEAFKFASLAVATVGFGSSAISSLTGTLAAVIYVGNGGTTGAVMAGLGSTVKRAGNGAIQATAGGSYVGTPALTLSAWHLVIFTADGSGGVTLRVDGNESSGSIAPQGALGGTAVGNNSTGASHRLLEFITWPTVLNSTQRTAVYTALKSAYPVIP